MKISTLEVECDKGTTVKVWADCHSADDIEDLIAWLNLAKSMMRSWDKIKERRNAKAAQTSQAPAGKNENSKPRQIQGAAHV